MELQLSEEERDLLLLLLKNALAEKRVEVRRAEIRDFRRDAKREAETLRAMIARIAPPDAA